MPAEFASTEFASMIVFLGGMLAAMLVSCRLVSKGMQLQQEILQRGAVAEGRVLRVWRPPVMGSFARVYFEFEPQGHPHALRCCHVDRRPPDELLASLPAPGAAVRVRYLPDNPAQAVIARLVSKLGN